MSFDISTLAASDTFDVEIMNPNTDLPLIGEDSQPVTVTVFGPGTAEHAKAVSANNNRTVQRFKRKGNVDTTPEEDAANRAAFLTPITKSFNNFTYRGMEGGPEAFRSCYLDPKMGWLTEQVSKGAGDWANFTPGSANS